jgi:hypothetical protein
MQFVIVIVVVVVIVVDMGFIDISVSYVINILRIVIVVRLMYILV